MTVHPFKASLLFAVPMVAAALAMIWINPSQAGNLPEGFRSPVLAFEFQRSVAETAAFFSVDRPLQYRNDLMAGIAVDYLFMWMYTIFLVMTGWGIYRDTGIRLVWLPAALCGLVLFADLAENAVLQALMEAYFRGDAPAPVLYRQLHLVTWLKWGGLSVVLLMYAGYFLRGGLRRVIGLLMLFNFTVMIAAYLHRSVLNEVMAMLISLIFLMLVVHHLVYRTVPDGKPA